jgi:sugar lactone lactonase YvrE
MGRKIMFRRPLLLTVCLLVCLSWAAAPAAAAVNLSMRAQTPQDSAQFTYYNILPNAVAVDGAGNVFVSDKWNSTIKKFDANGQLLLQFGGYGTGPGQLNNPRGVTVDGSGNIYVADSGNNRIQKFDANGQLLLQWNSYPGGTSTVTFSNPTDVALDSEGYVYVVDYDRGRVVMFDSDGNWAQHIFAVGINSTGLVIVGTGTSQYFYMVNDIGSAFFRYRSYTGFKGYLAGSGSGDGQVDNPAGLAVDGSGNFYVADKDNHRIQIFDASGNYLGQWSLGSFYGHGPWGPVGVAVDGSGNAYVADYGARRILKFDASHALVATWGSMGPGNGQFIFPMDIAVDSQGNFYVADPNNSRVQKFNAAGQWLANFGSDLTNFSPQGVAVNANDELWVADWNSPPKNPLGHGLMRKFDSGGTLLTTWSIGSWTLPYSVAVHNGHLYVADAIGTGVPIMKFDEDGNLLASIGSGIGFFVSVAVDGYGNIYAADQMNPPLKIRKFDSGGSLVATWGSEISKFNPNGLAVDAAGNLYVSDIGPNSLGAGNCIRMFDASGNNVATWTNYSPGNEEFSYPAGLALSGSNLYVADNRSLVLAIDAYTITASAGAHGDISPSGTVVVNNGTDQTFDFTPAATYHVADVLVDGSSVGAVPGYTFSSVTADHTIAVSFTLDTHTITASAGDHGSISPSGATVVNYGADQTFDFTPAANYHVASVTVDGTALTGTLPSSYTFSNVTTDHTIAVSFAIDTRTITASAGDHGSISPSGATAVNYGADQTFDFTPATNYHVASVTVDGTALTTTPLPTSYTFNNVTTGHTIAVSFALDTHTITAATGANGSISPSGTVVVNGGADQTFTFTPAAGYHVAEVLVDGGSVGAGPSYTFSNVTTDHTIAVSFASDTYTITAAAGYGGSITPAGSVQVNCGGSQSFTIKPNTNHNIKTVLVDNVSVGPLASYTFNPVTANHSITANFVATVVAILTDKDLVRVRPGKTVPVQVKLSEEPQANVTVTVAKQSGSSALSLIGPDTLTFTLANWNSYQTIQFAATPGKNDMKASAVFELTAPGQTGKQVTAVKGQTSNIGFILNLLLNN